jgi:ribosomal protein S18
MNDKRTGDRPEKFDDARPPRDAGPGFERPPKPAVSKLTAGGKIFIDYKEVETLRRLVAANGKLVNRKRNNASALEQRLLARAIKRARHMALLPYVASVQ